MRVGTAAVVYWYCVGVAFVLSCYWAYNAWALRWGLVGEAVVLLGYCTRITLVQHRLGIGTTLVLHWSCYGTVRVPHRY